VSLARFETISDILRPGHSSTMILPQLKDGTEKTIEKFLSEKLRKVGAKGFVLGVSGGVDSAVVLRLAARAVGKDKVLALLMPEKDSPKDDFDNSVKLCKLEGVRYKLIDITEPLEAFKTAVKEEIERKSLANIKARCRMVVLYHYANNEGRLVLGTSNKSETLVGYFTKYGDGAADLEPIMDLYKTEVWELARKMKLPKKIVEKTPSAGLWKGQTDEGEMGITYRRLDAILYGIEQGLALKEIAVRAETTVKEVMKVERMVRSSSHKRKSPPAAKIGLRTPGLDWRDGDEDV